MTEEHKAKAKAIAEMWRDVADIGYGFEYQYGNDEWMATDLTPDLTSDLSRWRARIKFCQWTHGGTFEVVKAADYFADLWQQAADEGRYIFQIAGDSGIDCSPLIDDSTAQWILEPKVIDEV
jgi:hypothetical protein